MIKYQCSKCNKGFKQKIDYNRHINRIRPCIEVNNIDDIFVFVKEDVKCIAQKNTEMHNFAQKNTEMHNFAQKNDDKFACNHCNKLFSRNYTLKRHLDLNMCKIKIMIDEQNNNKDKMIELLVKQLETKYEQQIEEYKNEIQLKNQHQIEELKQTILSLETKINKSSKKVITTNSNNTNSNTNSNNTNSNNTNLIIQFGNENPAELLKSNEIAKIINRGYCAIQESVKQTHFNKRLPQLHNIYVSDLAS